MIFRAYRLFAFLSALVTWNASSSATLIPSSSISEILVVSEEGSLIDAGRETIDSENPSFDRMISHKELVSRMIGMEKKMKSQNERIKFQDERIYKQDKKIILLETRITTYNNHNKESKYKGSSNDPHSKEVIQPSVQNAKKGKLPQKRQSLTRQKSRLCTHLYDQNNPDAVIPIRGNFMGLPTNCYDLRLIGHYLNAYYLVKHNDNVGLVFCNFSEPSEVLKLNLDEIINIASLLATSTTSTPTITSSARTTITTSSTTPSSVHFFVQRRSPSSNAGIINFEIEKLNMGGAMNLATGIFTAPKNGVYHFNFAGMKKNEAGNLYVKLRRNAKEVAHTDGAFSAQVAFVATIRLQKGETIDLYKEKDGILYDSSYYSYTSFTGSLIMAE